MARNRHWVGHAPLFGDSMKTIESLRPKKVRILGREYNINYTEDLKPLGQCDVEECTIQVRTNVHPVEEADSLLHEIMHGVFYLTDVGFSAEQEEHVVRKLATGLIQVFMDNPNLLTYLANAGPAPRRR